MKITSKENIQFMNLTSGAKEAVTKVINEIETQNEIPYTNLVEDGIFIDVVEIQDASDIPSSSFEVYNQSVDIQLMPWDTFTKTDTHGVLVSIVGEFGIALVFELDDSFDVLVKSLDPRPY